MTIRSGTPHMDSSYFSRPYAPMTISQGFGDTGGIISASGNKTGQPNHDHPLLIVLRTWTLRQNLPGMNAIIRVVRYRPIG